MIHRLWPYTDRLVATMADSSLLDDLDAGAILRRAPRSGGLHMSTVLRKMYPISARPRTATLGTASHGTDDIDEEQLAVYGLMGLAFEDRAELALHKLAREEDWPYFACRSEEVDFYGVKGSPDIILTPKPEFPDHTRRELSLKVKWRSSRGLPLEEGFNGFPQRWGYELAQCMAYSGPLGTTGAVLLTYFTCGNWKPPMPHVLGWELDFLPEEVDEVLDAVTTIATELVMQEGAVL